MRGNGLWSDPAVDQDGSGADSDSSGIGAFAPVVVSVGDLHLTPDMFDDLENSIIVAHGHSAGKSMIGQISSYGQWTMGHSHSPFKNYDTPSVSYRTERELDVNHDKIKRLDMIGGKALWKHSSKKGHRKWYRFEYDHAKKEIVIEANRKEKVTLRGSIVEEYERYLARLVVS